MCLIKVLIGKKGNKWIPLSSWPVAQLQFLNRVWILHPSLFFASVLHKKSMTKKLFSADSDNSLAILGHAAQLQGLEVLNRVWILSSAWNLKSPMPDKFSKIYQNKIIGVVSFIKSQIPEIVKDAIRFQLLSNVLSYSCLWNCNWNPLSKKEQMCCCLKITGTSQPNAARTTAVGGRESDKIKSTWKTKSS